MRTAGLVAAGTSRRYGDRRQAWVASTIGASRAGYSNALVMKDKQQTSHLDCGITAAIWNATDS